MFKRYRRQALERRLAYLQAELAAVKEVVNKCDSEVPGVLVLGLVRLPAEIAETETRLMQLSGVKV